MSSNVGKVLLVRLDRIGDLVLTLPIDESLKKIDPAADLRWWIPRGLGFVANNADPKRDAREVDPRLRVRRFLELFRELRRDRHRLAIVYHAPWWISVLLFIARIPVRAGPRSQWHQFIFFNRGIRQKRSRAEAHELEYNYQLTERALGLGPGWLPRNSLRLTPPAPRHLERRELEAESYIVVHPGMSGSALNWSPQDYSQLIQKLIMREERVVITGTPTDERYLAPIRTALPSNDRVRWLDGALSGTDLLIVLSGAKAVVAPSTGVLHLAAACGVPTLGIYSPVPVQSRHRWGPVGARVQAISPDVSCPAHFKCLGPRCGSFDCMRTIQPGQVLAALDELISSKAKTP